MTTNLEPPAEPMSAAEALRRVDVMIACMAMWDGKRSEFGQLMQGWQRLLRDIRPHVAAAADRSNAP
jgi:hypothetical protein